MAGVFTNVKNAVKRFVNDIEIGQGGADEGAGDQVRVAIVTYR